MTASGLKIDVRRKRILELLERHGQVNAAQLSEMLGATTATIRTDLRALEEEGYAERIQGGAILKTRFQPSAAATTNLAEKKAIALAAADVIQNGDTLFINAGTTTREIALALKGHRGLNIVTNSVAVAMELSGLPTIRLVLLGGELNTQYAFTCGGDAQEQLRKYQADYAILSLDGVSVEAGVTTYHADEAIIDRMMVERAGKTLVAADCSKLGRAGFSAICPLSRVHMLVTDGGCPWELAEQFKGEGVQVRIADRPQQTAGLTHEMPRPSTGA